MMKVSLWSVMRELLASCQELVVVMCLERRPPEYPGVDVPFSVHYFLAPRQPLATAPELNALLAKLAAAIGNVQTVNCAEDDGRLILGCLFGVEAIGTKTTATKFVLNDEKGRQSRHEFEDLHVVTRTLWVTLFPNKALARRASRSASAIHRQVVHTDDPLFLGTGQGAPARNC